MQGSGLAHVLLVTSIAREQGWVPENDYFKFDGLAKSPSNFINNPFVGNNYVHVLVM